MRPEIRISVVVLALHLLANSVHAQSSADAKDYSPMMSDRYQLVVGGFWPDKSLTISVNGSHPNEDIEFDQSLRHDDDEMTFNGNFRWRFGEKWSLWAQYWEIKDRGGYVLDEDVEWEDLVFREGTFAETGLDMTVARIFFGRAFYSRPNQEFGVGVGAHWLELGAYLEGEIKTNFGDSGFERASVEAEFPLPNIGAWYHYSWHKNWVAGGRIDWLHASVGDYSGGLWNAQAGIDWTPTRHFGVGFYYQLFRLDGNIDKSDWRGSAKATQHGPLLTLTASW